eukprot:5223468-Prorocentrum_lima.AAC.1
MHYKRPGVTKPTMRNDMLPGKHHLASISGELKIFEHTAVQVSVSERMITHRDGNNMGTNWTISMGTFTGGL